MTEEIRPVESGVETEEAEKKDEIVDVAEETITPVADESAAVPESVGINKIKWLFILDLLRLAGAEYHGQPPSEIMAFREGSKVVVSFCKDNSVISVGIVPDFSHSMKLVVGFRESCFIGREKLQQNPFAIYPFEGAALPYYLELMAIFGITDLGIMLNDPSLPTMAILILADAEQPETEIPAELGDISDESKRNEFGMTK